MFVYPESLNIYFTCLMFNIQEFKRPPYLGSKAPLFFISVMVISKVVCNEEKLGLDHNVHGIPDIIPDIRNSLVQFKGLHSEGAHLDKTQHALISVFLSTLHLK